MSIIVEPKIVVEDIKIPIDTNNEYGAKNIIDTLGPTMPVVKINDYILSIGEVRSFNLNVGINKLPTFNMVISDDNFKVRDALRKETIDKTVIFIGFKDWYIKFNGIILNIPSEAGDRELNLNGKFFNEKLYNSEQKGYLNKSVKDVLQDICEKTDMGLYLLMNPSISNIIDYQLNTNKKFIEYFDWLIKKYTDNIWSIDTHGYFHVSSIEKLRSTKLDKFKIFNGLFVDEKDIIVTTDKFYENIDNDKFRINHFTINSNIGDVHTNSNKTLSILSNDETKILPSIDTFGIGERNDNTFSRFLNTYFPYYKEIVNKNIGGKVFRLSMEDLIYEISPLAIIKLEHFNTKDGETKPTLDIENSGNKIVINYEFYFDNSNEEEKFPKIKQNIDLI